MAGEEYIFKIFPRRLRELLERSGADPGEIQELRLRAGRPLFIICGETELALSAGGRLVHPAGGCPKEGLLIVERECIEETVELMSRFSLYAAQEELRQGFFTIQGGHRVGVAGRVMAENGTVRVMRSISFLNVRVAHEKKGCADWVMPFLYGRDGHFYSTLIISPPRRGKTTLLRDIIRQASDGCQAGPGGTWIPGMSVGVVDERSELGACWEGHPQNDLGMRTDVLDCCPKSQGMMMLVRSMSPSLIAVDEIGGEEDAGAAEYAGSCGCALAASAHGRSLEEVRGKRGLGRLLEEGIFERLVLLAGEGRVGRIEGIYDGEGRAVGLGRRGST